MTPAPRLRRVRRALTVATLMLVFTACNSSTGVPRPVEPPPPAEDSSSANSADRILFWVNYKDVIALSDQDLDEWQRRGIGGFVTIVFALKSMGGNQDFTGNPKADLSGPNHEIQRAFRDTKIVERAQARGMKMYLGFYLNNYGNNRTPMAEWFDDPSWAALLPDFANIAGAAKTLGFEGLAVDQEVYFPKDVAAPSWSISYAGNVHGEAATRAKVKQRGAQVMGAILSSFPAVDIFAYDTQLPKSWAEVVQSEVNGIKDAYANTVHIDFWDGMSSVEGYRAIRFVDSIFYKVTHVRGVTWDTANEYNLNQFYSLLSRRWSNWSYASERVFLSPFSWLDEGPSSFDSARSADHVAEQLLAFRRWGTGRAFANFVFGSLQGFDYGPYEDALRAASKVAIVDSEPPVLSVAPMTANGSTTDLTGTATDNFGIRAVRWASQDMTRQGVAQMEWKIDSGDPRDGFTSHMDWTIHDLPVTEGEISITAEDVKGLVTTVVLPLPS